MSEDLTINQDDFPKESSFLENLESLRVDNDSSISLSDGLKTNYVHPTAIVDLDVIRNMGKGNYIGAYCIITGDVVIGNNNRFESHCVIGSKPEHKKYWNGDYKGVTICDNNIFREFTTVNSGTETHTHIGNNVIMLRGSHVGHDAFINDNVTLSCNVAIGGHSYIGEGTNFGIGSVCHQNSIVGCYCMIGMNSTITKSLKVDCFKTIVGSPARIIKNNDYAIEKMNIEEMNIIIERFCQSVNLSYGTDFSTINR